MIRRVALVTGGSYGIGEAIAQRLADDGLEVVVTGRDEARAHAVAQRLGGRALAFDVADHDAAIVAVATAGPFDVLVNNAGWDHHGWFAEMPASEWKRVLAVNLEGVLSCTQAVLPGMRDGGWGRVITIGSEAGRIGSKGAAAYAAAKAGVVGFTLSIAREYARFAITANVVSPGPIDTPALREMTPEAIAVITAQTQLKRLGTAREVAAAVAFLASEDAGYVTGETLGVSGGMHLGG